MAVVRAIDVGGEMTEDAAMLLVLQMIDACRPVGIEPHANLRHDLDRRRKHADGGCLDCATVYRLSMEALDHAGRNAVSGCSLCNRPFDPGQMPTTHICIMLPGNWRDQCPGGVYGGLMLSSIFCIQCVSVGGIVQAVMEFMARTQVIAAQYMAKRGLTDALLAPAAGRA